LVKYGDNVPILLNGKNTQDPPCEKEFAKEPPQLPAQLYLGVLNSRSSEEGCARPRHVVLDHLYIEKGWGAQPLVALGYTHRLRSKYVTCVLYKAIER
jgi:5'-AMP-activated protein kinase regulatory beta subunit